MPSTVQATTHIFEDPEESPSKLRKKHNRVPSVGDVLRGRKMKDKDSHEPRTDGATSYASQSPLGERHLNSPPPARKVPLKDETPRPPMHKKTNSGVSLKSLMRSKDKSTDGGSVSSLDGGAEVHKPKKTKSSTNLAGLLRKKSKKDLQAESHTSSSNQENVSPASASDVATTPIWAQFATQPLEGSDGKLHYPPSQSMSVKEQIALYTPKDYSEFRPSQQRNFYDVQIPSTTYLPPQRPFLEHKTSRSSIFKEEIDDDDIPPLNRPKSRERSCSRPASARQEKSRPPLGSHLSNSSQASEESPKRSSRVLEAFSTFTSKSRKDHKATSARIAEQAAQAAPLSAQELDLELEKVMEKRNIPLNMRNNMRSLTADVKKELIRGDRIGSGSSTASASGDTKDPKPIAQRRGTERPQSQDGDEKEGRRSRSRSRPRSGILTMGKRDGGSPTKKQKHDNSTRSRSKSRPRSIDMTISSRPLAFSASSTNLAAPDSSSTPGDFIHYLREVQKPELVEVGKLHKLRILLRNESVSWTDAFVTKGGMDELVQLLYRIIEIEWREEHEDSLLHENLLCLKALCTTSLALQQLTKMENEFFPKLLAMLFDVERKGPADFSTRGIITSLLFAHLSAAVHGPRRELEHRAKKVLELLKDPKLKEEKQLPGFISQMHISRPYKIWCREVVNVTKEVFWIFLHHMNVIPIIQHDQQDDSHDFAQRHFPPPRPPHPAAPYVGGVEWEATQYLSTHLDTLNGLMASLPTQQERNALREDMKQSGWEKVMGGTLRTCKEKFYGSVHEGLKVWIAAAKADGWAVEDVRAGPPREASSPKKSPVKKKGDEAPKIALDVGVGGLSTMEDAWV